MNNISVINPDTGELTPHFREILETAIAQTSEALVIAEIWLNADNPRELITPDTTDYVSKLGAALTGAAFAAYLGVSPAQEDN